MACPPEGIVQWAVFPALRADDIGGEGGVMDTILDGMTSRKTPERTVEGVAADRARERG